MRILCGFATICVVLAGAWLVNENGRLRLVNSLQTAEVRLLQQELSDLRFKPTYDDGVYHTLVKIGQPNSDNAFADGWNCARRVYENEDSASAYHRAISQFGIQIQENLRNQIPAGTDE